MRKPFRKLEVLMDGTVYVLGRAEAEALVFRMTNLEMLPPTLSLLRDDLRAALATETEGPAPVNPFDGEPETPAPWEKKTNVERPTSNVQRPTEEGGLRCLFCGMPGESVCDRFTKTTMWRCVNKDCFRNTQGYFTRKVFEEGV